MNPEPEKIDDGDKMHLPNGFSAAWLAARQMKLEEALAKDLKRIEKERIKKAIGDFGETQKPKFQGPGE